MLSHNLYSDLSNDTITDISFSLFIYYSNNLDVSMLSDRIISGGPTLNDLSYSDTNINVTQGITWFRSEVDISSNNIGSDISWVHIATFDISNTQMDLSMRYLYGAPSLLYGDSDADVSAQSFIQYFDCSNGFLRFIYRYPSSEEWWTNIGESTYQDIYNTLFTLTGDNLFISDNDNRVTLVEDPGDLAIDTIFFKVESLDSQPNKNVYGSSNKRRITIKCESWYINYNSDTKPSQQHEQHKVIEFDIDIYSIGTIIS